MNKKLCRQEKNIRFAQRNGQLVAQQRKVRVFDCNPWYNPFGLNYFFEYSAWEDMPIADADTNENE